MGVTASVRHEACACVCVLGIGHVKGQAANQRALRQDLALCPELGIHRAKNQRDPRLQFELIQKHWGTGGFSLHSWSYVHHSLLDTYQIIKER